MERGSGRSSVVSGPAILAAVLEAAVDSPARPVAAVVPVPALRLLFQMLQRAVYIH